MEFDYTVPTEKSVDEALASLLELIPANGFRVLYVHDVQETLAEKGFERPPLRIVETCNAKHAHAVLEQDVKIALMLPCPIAVYEEGGRVSISTLRPTAMTAFYPDADIAETAEAVDEVIRRIVDEAAA